MTPAPPPGYEIVTEGIVEPGDMEEILGWQRVTLGCVGCAIGPGYVHGTVSDVARPVFCGYCQRRHA